MQKNLFILLSRVLIGRLCLNSPQLIFKVFCCSIILAVAIQLLPLKVKALPNINEDLNFDNQSSETLPIIQNLRELKPGETILQQVEKDGVFAYQIFLEAGKSIDITIGKNNMAFVAWAIIPDPQQTKDVNLLPSGNEVIRVYGQPGSIVEPLVIVADKSNNYIVKVRLFSPGTYSITCGMPRETTEIDKKFFIAQKLLSEERKFWGENDATGKAVEILEERIKIYRSIGESRWLARSLSRAASANTSSGQYLKSINYLQEAIKLFRSLESSDELIWGLLDIGWAFHRIGDYQSAIDNFNEALSISRTKLRKDLEASALHSLGIIYHVLADEGRALDFYKQSIFIQDTIVPPTFVSLSSKATTLNNIGNLYRGVGAQEKVLEYFNLKTANDRQKAIEYYQQSLEVWRSLKKIRGLNAPYQQETEMLLKIGNTYKELGNVQEAFNYLDQSLESLQNLKTLNLVHSGLRVNVLRSIGNLYFLKGEYQKTFEFYEQTKVLLKTGAHDDNQAEVLNSIAKDYYRAGETQKALDLYNEALAFSRKREQRIVYAASLFEIAQIERDLGNFHNARKDIEEVLQVVESVRAKITAEEIRATYFATVKRYYDFYIDLLMQAHKSQQEKGFDALALQTSERARSRSLLDLLSQARIDIRQGIDPALLEREQQTRKMLIEKAYLQNRLLLTKHTKEEAEKIEREIATLTNEYQAIQAEIKNKSPRYAALTQPTSLLAKQIQQLLDSGTILLEYSLGEKKSYLWAVTNDSITSFDLPKREEIESQARRVYELLTVRNEQPRGETDTQRLARIKAAEEAYPKEAAKLSKMLLAPAASQIGNKRLLIVPDGTLNYIPFSALPSSKIAETANLPQPLGISHEIVTLPSASILALLREETQNRKPAPKMLAVFADPVFTPMDVRANSSIAARTKGNAKQSNVALKTNTGIEEPSFNRDFERAISDVGLRSGGSGGLPRLPFSRREADSIFKVSPKNLSLKEVDFDANKTAVFNSDLEQYRILHFATHGLLNSQHPELSGIVLSLVDKKGGDIDGFLRLQDIYNLKLSADLVVLSACNTALGKDVKGEGLIGLTRGFMYAGAPRVVASLWKVDDAATAEFMSIFYRKMLVENLRPAAALRAAQAEMMKQTRWKSPYYWAPFIIQGEWK